MIIYYVNMHLLVTGWRFVAPKHASTPIFT